MMNSTLMNSLINRKSLALRTLLPAIIDSEPKQVGHCWCIDVLPAIRQKIIIDGIQHYQNITKLVNVPLVMPSSQSLGLSITMPIHKGDECLLAVCDRSIDNWQLAGGIQNPAEETITRHHDLTDAVAIPSMLSANALAHYPNDAVQIGSKSVHIAVDQNSITATDGTAKLKISDGTVSITGDLELTGNVQITGDLTATGIITAKDFIRA